MSERRMHTKSRRGCQQCKANHIKCDENKVGCQRCKRLGLSCSLLDPNSGLIIIAGSQVTKPRKVRPKPASPASQSSMGSIHLHQGVNPEGQASNTMEGNEGPSRAATHSPSTTASNGTVSIQPLHFDNEERHRLRLISHWTQHTAKTIADLNMPTPEGVTTWSEKITALAFEHDFLLHGILSASALHLALQSDMPENNNYATLAMFHHDKGVALFRQSLDRIVPDNSDAIFTFSLLIVLHSFGIHRTKLSEHNALAKIHELMMLIRGTTSVAVRGGEWLGQGIFSSTTLPIGMKDIPDTIPPLQDEIERTLSCLHSRIHTSISTSIHAEMYTSTINILRQTLYHATNIPYNQTVVILFPAKVPAEFFYMLCISEPLALAIIANYAVVLHWKSESIWLRGWGKEIIDAAQQLLPTEWQDCIRWAVNEASIDTLLIANGLKYLGEALKIAELDSTAVWLGFNGRRIDV